MDLREIGWEIVDWKYMAHDKDQRVSEKRPAIDMNLFYYTKYEENS